MTTPYLLVSIEKDQVNGHPAVRLFGRRGLERKSFLVPFTPYFYVPESMYDEVYMELPEDVSSLMGRLYTVTRKKAKSLGGDTVVRLDVRKPEVVPVLRKIFERHRIPTYEADVIFVLRFMIDTGLREGFKVEGHRITPCQTDETPRVCLFDVESASRRSRRVNPASSSKVVVITRWDSYTNEYKTWYWGKDVDVDGVIQVRDERELLTSFIEDVVSMDYDVISGWNISGRGGYDLPKIYYRCRALGVDISRLSPMGEVYKAKGQVIIKGREVFDMLSGYKMLSSKKLRYSEHNALSYIARDRWGVDPVPIRDFYRTWKHNPEVLIERNRRDVENMVRLEREDMIIGHFDIKRRIVGVRLSDSLIPARVGDVLFLRAARGRYVLRSKHYVRVRDYPGAFVFDPKVGVHDNVALIDFSAMYPNIIISLNMSPETFVPGGHGDCYVIDDSHAFLKSPRGILAGVVEDLLKVRMDLKRLRHEALKRGDESLARIYDLRQLEVKKSANALYGIWAIRKGEREGKVFTRMYSPNIAESITMVGRDLIKSVSRPLMSEGRVLYGDTDSIFVRLDGEDPESLTSRLNDLWRRHMLERYGVEASGEILDLQCVFDRIVFLTKKRYFGLIGDRVVSKGIEAGKSDSSVVTSRVQRRLCEVILTSDLSDMGRVKSMIRDVIFGEIRKIRSGETTPLEMAVPRGLEKSLSAYTSNPLPQHVRASIYSNKYLGTAFDKGAKPKILYVKAVPRGYPRTDVIAIDEETVIPDGFVIDHDRMVEVDIKGKVEEFLSVLGLDWNGIVHRTWW